MLTISQVHSKDSSISLVLQLNTDEFLDSIPLDYSVDHIKELHTKVLKIIAELQVIVSHAKIEVKDYRAERASLISRLTVAIDDLVHTVNTDRLLIKASLNEKFIMDEASNFHEDIEFLSHYRNEYETLSSLKVKVAQFLKTVFGVFEPKIRFYKNIKKLIRGEIKATINLEGEYEYSFDVQDIGMSESFDQAAEFARWKEFLTKELAPIIDRTIEGYHDDKESLKQLLNQKFYPFNEYESALTVTEFLSARAKVVNFWNERFSFTETLSHHFFRDCRFYKFFEESILAKLTETKVKIDKRIRTLQREFNITDKDIEIFSNMKVEEFLNGKNLRLVDDSSLKQVSHRTFSMLKIANDKLAHEVWKQTEQEIARKLGGVVCAPGVIARKNRAANNLTMKTELIVISGQHKDVDPKALLGGKFRDLIATKSENFTELAEIDKRIPPFTVEMDIKLSYFLSTSKMAA